MAIYSVRHLLIDTRLAILGREVMEETANRFRRNLGRSYPETGESGEAYDVEVWPELNPNRVPNAE